MTHYFEKIDGDTSNEIMKIHVQTGRLKLDTPKGQIDALQ